MTNPNHQLADAIREVTVAMQKAIADGCRSRMIDADDLVEVLLAVADRLDPPVRDEVDAAFACPECGERHPDRLVWGDEDLVRCASCGITFDPAAG
jgi:rubredoxin